MGPRVDPSVWRSEDLYEPATARSPAKVTTNDILHATEIPSHEGVGTVLASVQVVPDITYRAVRTKGQKIYSVAEKSGKIDVLDR